MTKVICRQSLILSPLLVLLSVGLHICCIHHLLCTGFLFPPIFSCVSLPLSFAVLYVLYCICIVSNFCIKISKYNSYVPTLPFWTGDSRFDRTTFVFAFLPEFFRFEMILGWISDIYKFFKSITLFTRSMSKSWLQETKLVALDYPTIFMMSCTVCRSVSTKALLVLALAKEAWEMSLRINSL